MCITLEKLAPLISSKIFFETFVMMLLELTVDEVCEVRIRACEAVGNILVTYKNS
jgi:hypothetical protein